MLVPLVRNILTQSWEAYTYGRRTLLTPYGPYLLQQGVYLQLTMDGILYKKGYQSQLSMMFVSDNGLLILSHASCLDI